MLDCRSSAETGHFPFDPSARIERASGWLSSTLRGGVKANIRRAKIGWCRGAGRRTARKTGPAGTGAHRHWLARCTSPAKTPAAEAWSPPWPPSVAAARFQR